MGIGVSVTKGDRYILGAPLHDKGSPKRRRKNLRALAASVDRAVRESLKKEAPP